MSWFGRRAGDQRELTAIDLLTARTGKRSSRSTVSRDTALRNSVAWACLRLRADLISTMPVKVYRDVAGTPVDIPSPPVLTKPSSRIMEWLYSSQIDLDSCGNAFGLITARDGAMRPARIELVNADDVTVRCRKGVIDYRIAGTLYPAIEVWHERQFTMSGIPVGLSPIGYAAMTLNNHRSAAEFANDWFSNSTVPGGHLKNTSRVLKKAEAAKVKANFKASVAAGDVWVSGSDWDYEMLAAKASESGFLETMGASALDVCRFLGVPGDMVDVQAGGTSITYANITQRNLQFLITNLGPAMARREDAFSSELLAAPRYVKLNPGALLRMDLKSRYEAHKVGIDSRFLAPSEARELEDRPPFTPEQEAEFGRLFPAKALSAPPAAGGNQ